MLELYVFIGNNVVVMTQGIDINTIHGHYSYTVVGTGRERIPVG